MPDGNTSPRAQALHRNSAIRAAYSPAEADTLRPLARLRQLTQEIQAALASENMALVHQAAALLAPALAQLQEAQDQCPLNAEERQIARETGALLEACEAHLSLSLRRVASEMRRLHNGRRAISLVRMQKAKPTTGRHLDMQR
jgi:hypothetical protein